MLFSKESIAIGLNFTANYLITNAQKIKSSVKGYLHYKTILCHKVALDV